MRRLARRHLAELALRIFSMAGLALGMLFLAGLVGSLAADGWRAFFQHQISIAVRAEFDSGSGPESNSESESESESGSVSFGECEAVLRAALRESFPEAMSSRAGRRRMGKVVGFPAAVRLCENFAEAPPVAGETRIVDLPLTGAADLFLKLHPGDPKAMEKSRMSEVQAGWLSEWRERGIVRRVFHWRFFSGGDSRYPALAGLGGALLGSLMTLLVTLVLAFPIGVLAAVYLEEIAPRGRFADVVEVVTNNLAAVPSIVFGLLGLELLLNFFHMPRATPLVGGIVLAMMTLPTLIIASRAALRSVPDALRQAALALGANKIQTVFHHVLPAAMPGILTSAIIGMAQALGETAPLLMIGMVSFIAELPDGFLSAAAALPVQIFLWADSPERAYADLTAGAILTLLGFLVLMNLSAIILRQRMERKFR